MTGVILAVALLAQAPVIDNARVRVWQNTVPPVSDLEAVSVSVATPAPANVTFVKKGAPRPNATLTVELKDIKVSPFTNTTEYPNAFPRPNIKKLLENDRVIVWDYTWTLNSPTGMHNHDKDVVVNFLEDGDLVSTVPDGGKTVNQYKPGTVRFNTRDRVHFETLTRGKQRAIIVELK
jgi:hypothetical protein